MTAAAVFSTSVDEIKRPNINVISRCRERSFKSKVVELLRTSYVRVVLSFDR